MKTIDDLTRREKSVLLARARGWKVVGATIYPSDPTMTVGGYCYSLYEPLRMNLAWRIHMWMINSEIDKRESPYAVSPKPYLGWWKGSVPWLNEDVQEKLLDKVLSLCIEDGSIKEWYDEQ
jgi:hypothetical protein